MAVRSKAYSYIRFSSSEQAQGDSLRRQTEAALAYTKRHNLNLDPNLTFRDLGVSAFRGKNAVEGALAAFIQAVDSGRVKPGSYLLIESLDRLSRDRIMPALNQFVALLGKGIRIVTLSDGQEYDSESVNNLAGLIVPLVTMARANEESLMKSKRLRAAWHEKKIKAVEGHLITSVVPAWLRVCNGKIEVIDKRAEILRRIFDMAQTGHGKGYISRQLNLEQIPTFTNSNGWHSSYIGRILNNPAVIGIYQPRRYLYEDGRRVRVDDGEPIENYFPTVIEPGVFYGIKHGPTGVSGKKGNGIQNVLSGLAFCARCGGPLHFVSKGPPPKGYKYLSCDNQRRFKKCNASSVRYDSTVREVLAKVHDFRPINDDSEAMQHDKDLANLTGQIGEKSKSVSRILDLVEQSGSHGALERLSKLELELEGLKVKRQEIEEREIARHGSQPPSGVVYETFEDASPWVLADNPTGREDLAAFIRSELHRLVERIEIEKGKPVKITRRA